MMSIIYLLRANDQWRDQISSSLLFFHLSIHSSIQSFIPPNFCQSIQTSIHPSNFPSIHQLIHPSIHPLIHPSICWSIHSFTHPSFHPSISLSIHMSTHPSTYPTIHSSIHTSNKPLNECPHAPGTLLEPEGLEMLRWIKQNIGNSLWRKFSWQRRLLKDT